MVMPLLICCLIFALITGTLLTFFTSTSLDNAALPGSGTKPGTKPAQPWRQRGAPRSASRHA